MDKETSVERDRYSRQGSRTDKGKYRQQHRATSEGPSGREGRRVAEYAEKPCLDADPRKPSSRRGYAEDVRGCSSSPSRKERGRLGHRAAQFAPSLLPAEVEGQRQRSKQRKEPPSPGKQASPAKQKTFLSVAEQSLAHISEEEGSASQGNQPLRIVLPPAKQSQAPNASRFQGSALVVEDFQGRTELPASSQHIAPTEPHELPSEAPLLLETAHIQPAASQIMTQLRKPYEDSLHSSERGNSFTGFPTEKASTVPAPAVRSNAEEALAADLQNAPDWITNSEVPGSISLAVLAKPSPSADLQQAAIADLLTYGGGEEPDSPFSGGITSQAAAKQQMKKPELKAGMPMEAERPTEEEAKRATAVAVQTSLPAAKASDLVQDSNKIAAKDVGPAEGPVKDVGPSLLETG